MGAIDIRIDHKFASAVALVAIVHVLTFWAEIRSAMTFETLKSKPTELTIVPMTAKEWESYKSKKQIVQTDDSGRKEKPKDQAYLGEADRAYDRQTVAKTIDSFNQAAKGNSQSDSRSQKEHAKKNALKDLKLSDLGTYDLGAHQLKPMPSSMAKKGLENGNEKSQGFSSNNDYIEDVPLGDFTQLNTVEYKYYGFFNRIRGKLEQFWGKSLKEKAEAIYKSGRSIASSDQYITALRITMNAQGEIEQVQIKSSSGIKELDDAAIDSFKAAGPFPNPPSGLLVNGRAIIEWGFVVKS